MSKLFKQSDFNNTDSIEDIDHIIVLKGGIPYVMPWAKAESNLVGDLFLNGGNSFGAVASIGTNDAFALAFKTNNSERARISSSGDFGIGTTSPGARFHVNTGQVATVAVAAYQNSVGIRKSYQGTGSPEGVITGNKGDDYVNLSTGDRYTKTTNAINTGWINSVGMATCWSQTGNSGLDASINFVGTTDNVDLVFKSNNIESVRFFTTGEIGIGISASPLAKLHVKGTSDQEQFIVQANVTQSNTNPLIKLLKSDDSDLMWIHSDDKTNVYIGWQCGSNNDVGGGGIQNTGVGSEVLSGNTIGSLNCAFGKRAMVSNTIGSQNCAFGPGTLLQNVDGNKNIAIGYHALMSTVHTNNNVAIGDSSMSNTTSGDGSVAIGRFTLLNNISGEGLVAIGDEALLSNTAGKWSVALGSGAFYSSSTGIASVGIGINVNYYGVSASSNTYIGSFSAYNGNGSANVFIGYQSGYYETGNNTLFIDNTQRASESDARIKALIYGIFDASISNQILTINGNFGINTSTFGTNSTNVIAFLNGVAPATDIANQFAMWSDDIVAGNAAPHFRTEAGDIIKLFKGASLTSPLTTVTFSSPGTPDYTIQDLVNVGGYGFVTSDEAQTFLSVVANLQNRVNELEARLQASGQIA